MTGTIDDDFFARLSKDRRRVIILDDDPTGTQTASDIGVLLQPDNEAFRGFLASGERAVYVITNTRALDRNAALQRLRTIRSAADAAAGEAGVRLAYVLRGDSTLRGHIFSEMEELGLGRSAGLIVPAFPEGGRITIGGVHYLTTGGRRVPMNQTEFARDPVFGYSAGTMAEWIREVGGERPVTLIPLERLRTVGAPAVATALLEISDGGVVVPDVESDDDIAIIVAGLLDAEDHGRAVVARSAAPFASLRAGSRGRLRERVLPAESRLLVVCGSHTEASTRQLAALAAAVITLSTDRLFAGTHEHEQLVADVVSRARADLDTCGIAVVASERTRRPEHGRLDHGARVMDALVATARQLMPEVDGLICKGGITSADVVVRAVGATSARVLGQIRAGVPLWQVPRNDDLHDTIPVAVVPGNVGDDDTLVTIADQFGLRSSCKSATRLAE